MAARHVVEARHVMEAASVVVLKHIAPIRKSQSISRGNMHGIAKSDRLRVSPRDGQGLELFELVLTFDVVGLDGHVVQ